MDRCVRPSRLIADALCAQPARLGVLCAVAAAASAVDILTVGGPIPKMADGYLIRTKTEAK
jgi:hypothetical protein